MNDERGGPAGTNKGKSKQELDAIEKLIKEGLTMAQAKNRVGDQKKRIKKG